MSLAELMSKRAAENKYKIVHKQSAKLKKRLLRDLQKRVNCGYTSANIYPPVKYLFINHFDETLKMAKETLEEEGVLLRFTPNTAFRDPCFEVTLMRCSDD